MKKKSFPVIKVFPVLYLAIFAGLLIFGVIALIFIITKKLSLAILREYSPQFAILCAIAIIAIGYLAGNSLFKIKLRQINKDFYERQHMNSYRAVNFLRKAMPEVPVLFCIILFLLTGNYTLIIMVGVLFAIFIFGRYGITHPGIT